MILDILQNLGNLGKGSDTDLSDRLNYRYTSILFVALGVLVTTRQFVGDAIECWTPPQFSSQWIEYTNSYCWISNSYFLPMDSHHDYSIDKVHRRTIVYYQWTPLILFLQSFLFIIPHLLWRSIYLSAGIDIESIAVSATTFETLCDLEEWNKTVTKMARHIDRYLQVKRVSARQQRFRFMVFCTGNTLSSSYLLIKCLFFINIIFQFEFLRRCLGEEYTLYGYRVLRSLAVEGTPIGQGVNIFPRVTWCSLERRALESVHPFTMNCVLPINLFNEVVFIIVWFWLATLFVVNSFSCGPWITACLCNRGIGGARYVKQQLLIAGRLKDSNERARFKRFITYYLTPDGTFLVKMFSKNTSTIFVSDLLSKMFDMYMEKSNGNAGFDKCDTDLNYECNPTLPPNYMPFIATPDSFPECKN